MLELLPLIILFLIHHFLLTPLIRKKLPLYVVLTVTLAVLFCVFCILSTDRPDALPPQAVQGVNHIRPDIIKILLGVLLIGADLGIYFYLESMHNKQRLGNLETENLHQQLESLRFQINPHFFMNTLNNIHALVDIDPQKAKESIEEFSKMMRILLYEGESPVIPLEKETGFIEHYISLMRLRYPQDSVLIETSFPDTGGGALVPPLLMSSFVENAFKHGISYERPSEIRISVSQEDGNTVFRCSNTVNPSVIEDGHGLGLDNIRKRLSLLYGKKYTLLINQEKDSFNVLLSIPPQPSDKTV